MLSPLIYDFLKARGHPIGHISERKDGTWKKTGPSAKDWVLLKRKKSVKKSVKKTAKKKKTAAQRYKDVGEKIGGARKDFAALRKKQLLRDKSLIISPADGKLLEEEGQLKTLLTRDRQFGKIKELYDLAVTQGEEENLLVGYAKIAFVDALPAKPPDTKEGREAYVAMTRLVTDSIEQITDVESLAKIQDELPRQLLEEPYGGALNELARWKFVTNINGQHYIDYDIPGLYKKRKYIGTIINDLLHYENNKRKVKEVHKYTGIKNEEQKATAISMLDEYFSGSEKKNTSASQKDKVQNPKPSRNRRAQVGGKTAKAKRKTNLIELAEKVNARAKQEGRKGGTINFISIDDEGNMQDLLAKRRKKPAKKTVKKTARRAAKNSSPKTKNVKRYKR